MAEDKSITIMAGIGIIILFLLAYSLSNSPLYIFCITLGIMTVIFGFYFEGKEIKASISYFVIAFSVNMIQWIILIYAYYNNLFHETLDFFLFLIGAIGITLILFNQIRKKYFKSSENNEKLKLNILKDKTKLILLSIGTIVIIGSLAGLIVYLAPIFLYGITLGAMALVYGYYYVGKRVNVREEPGNADIVIKNVNVTWNYVKVMGALLILQLFILCIFIRQMKDDWSFAMYIWLIILALFIKQYLRTDNIRKENSHGFRKKKN